MKRSLAGRLLLIAGVAAPLAGILGLRAVKARRAVDYERCLEREMKSLSDWAERHKADLETAQKAGNTAALMAFAKRQQLAGLAAQQQCARVPRKNP